MSTTLIPAFLQKGDLVFVTSPAYTAKPEMVNSGLAVLQEWGLRTETGASVTATYGPFAGSDELRSGDLQMALDRADVKAIICTRGGYGISRYVDKLDWKAFEKNPKWLVGFSDVTLLHLGIQQRGFVSVHGPMVVHLASPGNGLPVSTLHQILFGKTDTLSYPVTAYSSSGPTEIEGDLLGGNLTLLVNSLATKSEISTEGKILFLEEVGERFYRIDRMVQHLYRAGKLNGLKAIVLGQFTDCPVDGFPFSIPEMLMQLIGSQTPVFSGIDAGHGTPNFPVLLGANSKIANSATGFIFTQNLLQNT